MFSDSLDRGANAALAVENDGDEARVDTAVAEIAGGESFGKLNPAVVDEPGSEPKVVPVPVDGFGVNGWGLSAFAGETVALAAAFTVCSIESGIANPPAGAAVREGSVPEGFNVADVPVEGRPNPEVPEGDAD